MGKFPVTRAGPQWTKKIRGTSIENATGGEGMSSTDYEVFGCGDWTILWAAVDSAMIWMCGDKLLRYIILTVPRNVKTRVTPTMTPAIWPDFFSIVLSVHPLLLWIHVRQGNVS